MTDHAGAATKGTLRLVHLYPREMNIYGDRGNTRALASRIARHRYGVEVIDHHPGEDLPAGAHLVLGGGGQDSGQVRVREDLHRHASLLGALVADGTPMLMVCGMYQLFGNEFTTADGRRLPGLGILDVRTRAHQDRLIGPIVLATRYGDVVGYENHSGSTTLGEGQYPLGTVRYGCGNNGRDGSEGALTRQVHGTYLHGPVLPTNPALADALIAAAADRAFGRGFEPEDLHDPLADAARPRQIARLLGGGRRRLPWRR